MGFLDRVIGGVSRANDATATAIYRLPEDRRFAQAERLAAEGNRYERVITGIRRRYNDTSTETTLRISGPGDGPAGIRFITSRCDGLRLGATVAITADGNDVVLDWDRMCTAWGTFSDPGQRPARNTPDPGIDDKAIDDRVLRRLKRGTPGRGSLTALEQFRVMGRQTENWDITVRCADGSVRRTSKDNVPFYARWYAAPGLDVPVALDPDDPGKVQVDWRLVAIEHAEVGGCWQDEPLPGSIAATTLSPAPAPSVTPVSTTPDPAPELSSIDALAPIEGVALERWAAMQIALQTARVAPAQYDSWATAEYGVAVGRYTAIDQAWQARMRSADWRVGAAMGEALEQARRPRKPPANSADPAQTPSSRAPFVQHTARSQSSPWPHDSSAASCSA